MIFDSIFCCPCIDECFPLLFDKAMFLMGDFLSAIFGRQCFVHWFYSLYRNKEAIENPLCSRSAMLLLNPVFTRTALMSPHNLFLPQPHCSVHTYPTLRIACEHLRNQIKKVCQARLRTPQEFHELVSDNICAIEEGPNLLLYL